VQLNNRDVLLKGNPIFKAVNAIDKALGMAATSLSNPGAIEPTGGVVAVNAGGACPAICLA
jgi:hypothetical protein